MASLGPQPEDFIWASGIENTFVPQTRQGHRALDEYQLMGHYEHWREDLALGRELGVQALRWGVPWYRVEPLPGEFNWQWTDQVIPYMVEELGITPIIDLMHYGTPFWLSQEFANEDYPRAVANYARAFAERYRGLVRWYTPLNEPLVNALMCGRRAAWPPYMRGDGGYIRIMLQLVKGMLRTVEALKTVDPDAIMVHVEATGLNHSLQEELAALALEEQHRDFLSLDLLTGRVTREHPLFSWLLRLGTSVSDLADIASRRITLDVLGMNFYPQWSTKQLYTDDHGRLAWRNPWADGAAFADLIRRYHDRYQVPVMITETSAHRDDAFRPRWLAESVAAIKDLRSQGVPVMGYTWFPMFTMIDWKYRFGRGPVANYRIELGLYRLNDAPGGPRWLATPLVDQYRSYIAHPAEAVGTLAQPHPAVAQLAELVELPLAG
jgi:beta-glucosidase/6-phospho-beta-glucosidase/beta-galactosidase